MMIVSNLLSTFGLTRRELHGREMGIPFIWMWCHWAVMTNNPLFKFKRNISQLIFGIFGWYIKCVIMMKLSIIRNNGEKVTYCWRGLLSASWFFTLANHCQVVSGAYHDIMISCSMNIGKWSCQDISRLNGLLFYCRSKNWHKKVWNIFTSSHSAPSRERPCTATSPFSTWTNKKWVGCKY